MMTIAQFTEWLGWASVINIAFLLLATLSVVCLRTKISSIHSKILGADESELQTLYFSFLSNYKVMTLGFFVAPYIALKLMAQ